MTTSDVELAMHWNDVVRIVLRNVEGFHEEIHGCGEREVRAIELAALRGFRMGLERNGDGSGARQFEQACRRVVKSIV
jgi:hypothetical protein